MNDRSFGYIILIFISVSILGLLGYSIWVLAFPKETRIITFSKISNLRIDDPVKIKGVTVATIKSITRDEKDVLVTIKAYESLEIHEGYEIYSSDKGILGERVIIIKNGDQNNAPVDKNDTLTGTFHRGVSDALGSTWKLKDFIASFKNNAGLLLSGSEEKPSFVSTFSNVIAEIDSFSNKLYNTATFLDAELTVKIDDLNEITGAARKISQEISTTVPGKIETLEEQLETITKFIDKLDPVVNTLTDVVIKIKDNKLIQNDYISSLVEQLKELQELIEIIQDGTARLKLQIKLGFKEKIPK